MRVRTFSCPATALAACGLLLAAPQLPGASAVAAAAPTPPSPASAPERWAVHRPETDTLRATVYRVDVDGGTVDVVDGVGLTVAVTRVHTVPETSVYVGDDPAGLAALRPGQLVEIQFWERDEGYGEDVPGRVARSIHVVDWPGPGGGR